MEEGIRVEQKRARRRRAGKTGKRYTPQERLRAVRTLSQQLQYLLSATGPHRGYLRSLGAPCLSAYSPPESMGKTSGAFSHRAT